MIRGVFNLKNRFGLTAFLGTFLVCMLFAAATQHAWEDYWITFKASRNLATGNGLVFTPGERLHTFTSPLGTLLPAGLSWVTGNHSDELVLWLFRVVSSAAFAGGILIFADVLLRLQQHRVAAIFTLALMALDAKSVDFTINGMETGLLILFLAVTIRGLLVPASRRMLWVAFGWAGLMWTRPDSCVYIAILGFATLLFAPGLVSGETRKQASWTLVKAGLICAAIYLPWLLWAWSYYGSPVPNTIVAKSTNADPLSLSTLALQFITHPYKLLAGHSFARWVFMPAYSWFGDWPGALSGVWWTLGAIAALVWVVPGVRRETRVVSLAFFLGLFFLDRVVRTPFPWYLPTAAMLGYLTLGLVLDQLLGVLGEKDWKRHVQFALRALVVMVLATQVFVTISVGRQMAVQQRVIENGVRKAIGLWLRENARSPKDTVCLEPLGYIGYFSQLKMLDYPGLSSREVIEARRRLGAKRENEFFLDLKPDWVVLRPSELEAGRIVEPTRFKELYEPVRVFDASSLLNAEQWLPGRLYLTFDQVFLVFHRKVDKAPASP
jgi:hypothetical protein